MIPDIEAEALSAAVQWFCYWRDARDPGGDARFADSPLTAYSGRAWARHFLSLSAMGSVINRMQLVALARAGESDAREIVLQLLLEFQSRGERLPTDLAAYNMDLAAGLLPLHQSPGPKRKDRMTRDWIIALAVAFLMDRFGHAGLRPTRNSSPGRGASARRSACAIVAEAYGSMNEKNVERIWMRLKRGMPTAAGWSSSLNFLAAN